MKHRTLWAAIDTDRSKWWYYGAAIALGLVLVGLSALLWASTGFAPRGLRLPLDLLLLLLPAITLPFLRKRASREAVTTLGAVALPAEMLPVTTQALHDVLTATGRMGLQNDLAVFNSDSLNAISFEEGPRTVLAVSSAFTALPIDEQRAGLALLVCRERVHIDSIVIGSKHGVPTDNEGNFLTVSDLDDPGIRRKVESSWLEAIAASDREALLAMHEPSAMLTLMKRLAMHDTRLGLASVEAAYGCLAWPFDSALGLTGEDDLPPAARAALAEVLASSGAPGAHPQYARIAHMRSVLPAAEREVPEPPPLRPVPALSLDAGVAVAGGDVIHVPAVAPVPIAAVVAGTPARPTATPYALRIRTTCPACGAGNVPTNRNCIACGKPLPAKPATT
ncbi:MAG: zinc ribbon domain-containing protein [Coriobacteriia bacterium]|nr:zinc ribbon domain-containing protein [Coriobacteriia bacterium]